VHRIELGSASTARAPRHVVPADWWQAAEPIGDFAYVGATVGPGFDFADFAFGRDDAGLVAALTRIDPQALRLL
jgi:predicted cupin superfamily sugar epimerase